MDISSVIAQEKDRIAKTYNGLNPQQAYDRAYYENLITYDPQGQLPTFLGTDQRDAIKPLLDEIFSALPEGAVIGDFGAGDGQTFALSAESIKKATVHIVEPSQEATGRYEQFISKSSNLEHGHTINAGIEELKEHSSLIPDKSLDLAVCIHAIYFFDEEQAISTMFDKLKPDGKLVMVYADEFTGTTGQAVLNYMRFTQDNESHENFKREYLNRERLFGPQDGQGQIVQTLSQKYGEEALKFSSQAVPSRFYSNTIGGIAEFGNITALPYVKQDEDSLFAPEKITSYLDFIGENPAAIDLQSVYDPDSPRHGMLSSRQDQRLVVIEKTGAELG